MSRAWSQVRSAVGAAFLVAPLGSVETWPVTSELRVAALCFAALALLVVPLAVRRCERLQTNDLVNRRSR
jgi:hypothetical protein